MNALVIGGDGFIGKALVQALRAAGHDATGTTRRGNGLAFDLMNPTPLPPADVAYIAAAMINIPVRGSEEAWRVNVDGTIKTIIALLAAGVFVVFLSSAAVYTRHVAYARHKAGVENFLAGRNAAVVRLDKVIERDLPIVTGLLVRVGEERRAGTTTWKGLR